jgi:SAM-dependent methyltransferase
MPKETTVTQEFFNVYDDTKRAEAYAALEFPNTYHLAYRDVPEILAQHVHGSKALDFGCGAGRSTRFLKRLGFEAIGVDISNEMIKRAQETDPSGIYRCIPDGDFGQLAEQRFDLVLSMFTFDNIPTLAKRIALLSGLAALLKPQGRMVLLDSTPEIYWHEWASFSTRDFPENRQAKGGEPVKIIMKDVGDSRPVIDVIWFHDDYLALFDSAGLELIETRKPLGKKSEPFAWLSETEIAPWVLYVLQKQG